ncbi:unnamed protein product [Effrenium voratum]|nr:unnamed protein product [Effrenium voratum]
MVANSLVAATAPPVQEEVELEGWHGEPEKLDDLTRRYIIEAKVSGRTAGTTLYLVQAKDRDNKLEGVVENQQWKLFLAAHLPVELSPDEYQIAHGASKFLKPDRVAKLQRERCAGELDRIATCSWKSDAAQVVLEVQEENSKSTSDAEKCSLRELLHDLEEEGVLDTTINSHTVERTAAAGQGSDDAEGLGPGLLACFS